VLVIVGLGMSVSACIGPFAGYCGPVRRDVSVTARFAGDADPNSGHFQVDMAETRDGSLRRISWFMFSSQMHGHITQAMIIDRASGQPLLTLQPQTGRSGEALRGEIDPYTGPTPFGELFSKASRNSLAVRLHTDLRGGEVLEQPLGVFVHNDWGRARCD
jgi:hypothetical protein